MKKHISVRLAVILIGMAATIVLFGLAFNTFFLEKYYIEKKYEDIEHTYSLINKSFDDDTIRFRDVQRHISFECEKNGIAVIVVDFSLNTVYSNTLNNDNGYLNSRVKDYIFGKADEKINASQSFDSYSIYEINDSEIKSDYLEAFGVLNNEYYIYMKCSVDAIRQSASVTNKFYVYMALCMIGVSGLVIILVIQNVTKPIKRLAKISEKMSKLDFEVKYEEDKEDEIGMLGKSMNILSSELEKTISDLKNANIELKKDIEAKSKIDEMRKEFISNVSHELKTPLAIISGYAEGLKDGIANDLESMDFYCDVILDETDKMNKMVMKLLTLNQLEFGGSTVEMERFDIIYLIEQILSNFSKILEDKNIKVVFDNSKPAYVWSDEFQIAEVITNYISNAINHIDGERIIFIFVERKNDKVRVSVRNTGSNISENDLEKIWIKFYKVDKSRSREYGGHGIGLSIVKAIMELLGENYGASNCENGVEFFFEVQNANVNT